MKDQSPWPYDYLTQAAPFNLLHSFIQTLGPGGFPELAQLNALLESQRPAIHLRSGRRLRFVPQIFGNLTFEEQYEPRCYIKGELQTRDKAISLAVNVGPDVPAVVAGGGGTILPEEIAELHAYGVARIFSPEDGRALGLAGMIGAMLGECRQHALPPRAADRAIQSLRAPRCRIAPAASAPRNRR